MANQPTKGPPYPKVKYSDAKFRDIIPTLPLVENLKVQYKAKGVWFQMISKRNNFYNCECCGVDSVGPTPIVDHLRGKKHRLALQAADKLFHPQYTAPRPTKSPARTPILDAYKGDDKSSASNASKGKLEAVSTVQKSKPGPASAQKPKPEGGASAQSKTTPIQKPGPACSKKPISNANSKSTPPVKVVEATTTNTSDEKPSETSEVSESKKTPEVKKENDENPSEESPVTVIEIQPEIVILDDDDDDLPEKKEPSPSKPEVKNTASVDVGQAIPVAATAVPKSQRPQKRNLNAQATKQNSEVNKAAIPPADRVINPAAVVAQSGEQQNEEGKPRYQQNRVIIPSANRKRELPNEQPPANQQQNFTKKTFSIKDVSTGEYEGIIGVEYVVKILKVYNDPEPFYECCLCEVVMDGVGMQTHLLGYNHRYKYIEKHFPTSFNQYKEHIGNIQVMGIIMDRLAKAIEGHHGRELPYECLSGEFRSNRHGVMTTVYSFRHASEYSGPSFTNVVDAKEVDDLYKNKVMYHPPKPDPKRKPTFDTRSGAPVAKKGRMERERDRDRERERERPFPPSSGRGNNARGGEIGGPPNRRQYRMESDTNNTVDDATHKLMVEEFLNNTRGKSRSPGGRRRRHRSRSRSPHRLHRRRSVSPLREGDIWQAYRHLVDRSKNELDLLYDEYRKDPEKHPVYDEEWRKFWKHRKEQLTREGLDHRNYDFQPEWVRYFAVRIEELYDESVEDIKISSRRRLILPMTNDELKNKRYHVKNVSTDVEEQQQFQPQKEHNRGNNEKPSVVGVLRLLTALEDYLGSLGPKVVDLLSKALLIEKTNPRDINEMILNIENCTILETAMEKLKGVLIAGLLEGPKVRAFNNVITETDNILRTAYKIRQANPQPIMNRPMPVPAPKALQQNFQQKSFSPHSQNTGSGGGGVATGSGAGGGGVAGSGSAASLLSQIDKKELATKLAAALTAQGKTDFNPEQLQQLIAVYSLIDKKKRDSAAASDKQKMTLSDTLTALLNPSSDKSGDALMSNRIGGIGGSRGGNFSNNNDKFGSLSNSSITNFVSMLNRDGSPDGGGTNGGDSDMWQNLQNIQSSLRLQNNSSNAGGGFGNNSSNVGRGFGNNNSMGGGGGGNYNRSGFGGQSGNDFNSGQSFNRSGYSGGNNSRDNFESRYRSSFQGMNNSNPSRIGGNDDMISGGRGINDMMEGGNDMMDKGGRGGNDMISRGRGGNDMMDGGRGGGTSGNNSFSSGNVGGSNFSSRGSTGTGANNTLGFTRGSYLGGPGGSNFGSNNFSGLSNFSTSITPGPLKNTFQRSSLGGIGGGGGGSNSGPNTGGSNFNRGANGGPSNFGGGSNFNNQQNKNNPGGGATFVSASNQRTMGGNQGGNQSNRSGANWRNQ